MAGLKLAILVKVPTPVLSKHIHWNTLRALRGRTVYYVLRTLVDFQFYLKGLFQRCEWYHPTNARLAPMQLGITPSSAYNAQCALCCIAGV
jgi:hypothetical protein